MLESLLYYSIDRDDAFYRFKVIYLSNYRKVVAFLSILNRGEISTFKNSILSILNKKQLHRTVNVYEIFIPQLFSLFWWRVS
ncbi:hypothetical protein BTEBP_50094 [Brochothrix thermosphacta]|nr:hypothetical protein BTEBP_50094 [Brochothrix thermosphacta]